VLISVHSQLLRHRRLVVATLATLALTLAALTAHSALMSGAMGDHMVGDAAAICLAVGGTLVLGGAVLVAAHGLRREPSWPLVCVALPAPALVPATTTFLVRAGPPTLLQVFRF
jgi:hypothetical protein